jgi:hypothetical protein
MLKDGDDQVKHGPCPAVAPSAQHFRPPGFTQLTEPQLKRNRTIMTAIHFVLTYPRWSISLFLVLAGLSLRLPSMEEAVRQPISDLRYLTSKESGYYAFCVSDTFERVSRQLANLAREQSEQSATIRDRNIELVRDIAEKANICGNATTDARRAIQTWKLRQPIPLVNNTSICSASDFSNLQQLLEQGPESTLLLQSQATNALDEYLVASRATVERISEYAKARATYDYNYFLGVKVQGCLDLLEDFEVLNWTMPLPGQILVKDLNVSLKGVLDALNDLTARVDVLAIRLSEFQISIQGFYLNYKDLFDRLSNVAAFIREFIPSGIAMPVALDMSGIPLGDSLLPSVFEIPDFPTLDVDRVISDSIREAIQVIERVLSELAMEIGDQAQSALKDLLWQMEELLTLEDYNPPQFVGADGIAETLSDELDFLRSLGQMTRRKVLSAWLGEGSRSNISSINQNMPLDWNVSNPDIVEGESSVPFRYMEPFFPLLRLPSIVSFLARWAWVAELLLQLFRLLHLRRMYKREATMKLPEISYIEDEQGAGEAEARHQSRMAVIQLTVLKQVLNPWSLVVGVCLPLMILGITTWMPYVVNSCIKAHNGTVIGRGVVAPLMINNATFKGSAMHASAQYACRQNLRRICRERQAETELLHRQDASELVAAQARLREAAAASGVLARCVNSSALDEQFRTHCCGLKGYYDDGAHCRSDQIKTYCPIDTLHYPLSSFRPTGEYLQSDSCADGASLDVTLEDSRFNCSALMGACDHVPCRGVDENLLLNLSVEVDCRVQVHLIKCCVLVALSTYHALLLNACATLAFCGVQRLRWRIFQPAGIELRTHMNAQGELVKGGNQADRLNRVTEAIRRFEMIGKAQILLSILLLVIWLSSFYVLSSLLSDLNSN